ncbi:MAG: DUF2149 domain-containing protein [Planctomycetes bacterium]|nr:DUF2149 domain-containing protein [Planctomycetota bacterium]
MLRRRTGRTGTRFRRVDEDPLAMLVNFFDCAIVFATALLLISQANVQGRREQAPGAQQEQVETDRVDLQHYRAGSDRAKGDGVRLGVAYRLATGDVIYVPDSGKEQR